VASPSVSIIDGEGRYYDTYMTEVNSRALLDAELKRLGPPLKLPSLQDPISFTGKLRCVEQNTPFDPK